MRTLSTAILVMTVLTLAWTAPGDAADPKGRTSGKITVRAFDSKVKTGFEVLKDEWIELEVEGQWRMGDKLDYTGPLGHIKFNKINKLGYLGTLVLQIGTAAPFPLNDELPFPAPASGPLYLWPNRQGFTNWKTDGQLAIVIRTGDPLKDKTTQPHPDIRRALALLNEARKTAGVDEVSLSADLSVGCQKHARYLSVNAGNPLVQGMKAHDEYKQLKEYSEEGARAGKRSVIHSMPPSVAIREWMSGFYHRAPLLHPSLKEIGAGTFQQGGEWASVIDCLSGTGGQSSREMVFYPEDRQTNVPTTFGIEVPDPLPKGHKGEAGYPITVQFVQGQKVSKVELTVAGPKSSSVPVYLSSPEMPASSFPQHNAVCAIPRQPLARSTTYQVELRCEVSGKPYSRTWSFTTAK